MKANRSAKFKKNHISSYLNSLTTALASLSEKDIEKVIKILLKARKDKKRIFLIGNGGGASNASHFVCDLAKGTLNRKYNSPKRFEVYCLNDNIPIMTAYANDLSYEDIFSEQLKNSIRKGDILIVYSGSGNSINLIKAVQTAHKAKAIIIGFLGFNDGGKLGKMVDEKIVIKSDMYGPCEDVQSVINHIIVHVIQNTHV